MRFFITALLFALISLAIAHPTQADDLSEVAKLEAKMHFERGNIYVKAQQWDRAIVEYLEANRLYPASAFLFNIAEVHRFAGHWKAAIEYYTRFLHAESSGALHDEAADTVARMVRARNEEVQQHCIRARVAIEKHEYDQAIAEYQVASELQHDPALTLAIGDAYRLKEDWMKALTAYRKYLEELPNGPASDRARQFVDQYEAKVKPPERSVFPHSTDTPSLVPLPGLLASASPAVARSPSRKWIWGIVAGTVATGAIIFGATAGSTRNPTPSLGSIVFDVGSR